MTKQKNIQKYFNQKEKLTLKDKVYFNQVKRYLTNCLTDDLGGKGDITSDTLIKGNPKVTAIIFAKQDGIVAGIEEITWLLKRYKIQVIPTQGSGSRLYVGTSYKKDKDRVKKGEMILKLSGRIKDILKTERTILNLLQRMSGIATETARLTKLCPNVLVCSTRKTPLGLMDKKAVTVGGGGTHRLGLNDWILIKDNHIKCANYEINTKLRTTKFWEIEVTSEREFKKALTLRPDAIMLDNFKPQGIKKLLTKYSKDIKNTIVEASGGINEKNIAEYAKTGVNVISLGALTHSAKALDISLEIL